MLANPEIARATKILKDQEGQGLTEYVLILVLVSIVSVGILTTLGHDVSDLLNKVIPLGGG